MSSYYARPVPGSAALKTCRLDADAALAGLEQLDAGQFERRRVGGDALGRAVIRDGFVPVLNQVFDELLPRLSPIEQVLYLQLYRRSYGEERNFCRVARRELCRDAGLSLRRFNRALAGLVRHGAVALLQRNRRGTFYRVRLPREISGQQPGSEVLLGRIEQTAEQPVRTRPERGPGRPRPAADRSHKMQPDDRPLTVGRAVEALSGLLPPAQRRAGALELVQELTAALEEGADLAAVYDEARALLGAGRFDGEQFARALRQRLQLDRAPE
ncbi:MAG: hypothetical protein JXR83_08940 [Deltaproteobacteria bacterium]|nr:hypothetical protein [Deltaproteobacteria bacterium]